MSNKYDDIINLHHHISTKHPQMTIEARAAQFAPFAALTGYDDEINETARLTSSRIELDEESKKILNDKIKEIIEKLPLKPIVTITYFLPDSKKEGGMYLTVTNKVIKVDKYNKLIILEDRTEIPISEIIDIYLQENNI